MKLSVLIALMDFDRTGNPDVLTSVGVDPESAGLCHAHAGPDPPRHGDVHSAGVNRHETSLVSPVLIVFVYFIS